jgi:hypothetical protein
VVKPVCAPARDAAAEGPAALHMRSSGAALRAALICTREISQIRTVNSGDLADGKMRRVAEPIVSSVYAFTGAVEIFFGSITRQATRRAAPSPPWTTLIAAIDRRHRGIHRRREHEVSTSSSTTMSQRRKEPWRACDVAGSVQIRAH